jgi:hypothetical protein
VTAYGPTKSGIFKLKKNSIKGINDKQQSRKTIDTDVPYGVDRGSKTTGRAGSAGARLHLLVALAIGYLLQVIPFSKPSRANPKALPHIGATGALSAFRFQAGKIRE